MGNKKKAVNVYLSENTLKALDVWHNFTGLSRSQTISIAVSRYLLNDKNFKNLPQIKEMLEGIIL